MKRPVCIYAVFVWVLTRYETFLSAEKIKHFSPKSLTYKWHLTFQLLATVPSICNYSTFVKE